MSITLNEVSKRAHETAKSKGWHESARTFGDLIALIHSELSEALEEFRAGREPDEIYHTGGQTIGAIPKPEGVPIELADIIIRIGDLCGQYGIDLESAVEIKMAYNLTRSQRHGGKVL